MRFHIGPLPEDDRFEPEQGPWRKLREPSFGMLMLIASLVGVGVVVIMVWAWGALADLAIPDQIQLTITLSELLRAVVLVIALMLAHELSHALALPGFGLTSATIVGFWPQKATPYVAYRDEITRNRQILVGVMPFLVLPVLPLVVGPLLGYTPLWLVVLSTLNGAFSSADLLNGVLLLVRLPRSAVVRDRGPDAWWRLCDDPGAA